MLLLVLILLLAAYFGIRLWNKKQEEKQEAKKESDIIYITDLKGLIGINYDVGNGNITLEKQDDGWIYTMDQDFPLAQSYPEQRAETFGKLKADRELEDGDELAAYGLDEPVYTVELTDSDGTVTTLYFGNLVDDFYYGTVNDKDKPEILPIIEKLVNEGYEIYATSGTAKFFKDNGLENVMVVPKIWEGTNSIPDLIHSGKLAFIINTPTKGKESNRDGFKISSNFYIIISTFFYVK